MTLPRISLIIPVYGAERCLPKCMESILQQSFTDFEVILVDDLSKDNSGKLCDDYAAQDSRVRVLHKTQNGGPGLARQDGLAVAHGEWILFADSDDWLMPDTLQVLSEKTEDDLDILVFGMKMCHENANGKVVREEVIVPTAATATTREAIGDLLVALDSERSFPYLWNKLYRARLLHECGATFPPLRNMEDFFYNVEVFRHAEKVSVIAQPLYCYRKPTTETLVSAYSANFFALCKKRNETEKVFIRDMGANSEENRQKLDRIHLNHLISCLIKNAAKNSPLTAKEQRQKAADILKDPHTRDMLRHIRCSGLQYNVILLIFKCKLAFAAVWVGKLANALNARAVKRS